MEHVLHLYQDEGRLLDALARFVADGLAADDAVIVIGSPPRWELLVERLEHARQDACRALVTGQLQRLRAHSVLAAIMRARLADRLKFNEVVGNALRSARLRHRRVRVFSELSDALWRDGERVAARALERLWTPLLSPHGCRLVCACAIDSLEHEAYDGTLQALCDAHTHVHPAFDEAGFDDAVNCAVAEVLDAQLARMLHALSMAHRPAAEMPPGQAVLFWLKDHMPRTAEKVMQRARARWSEH